MRSLSLLLVCACWVACADSGVEDRFNQGLQLLYENRHEDAEIHFLSLARELVRSDLPDAAQWRAKALYQSGKIDFLFLDQPRRAIGRLREALKANPEADFAFDARYDIASIYYNRLMDYRNAALAFERLAHEFPQRENIAQYQYRLAQCYFLLRDFDQARAEARLLNKKWPKSPYVQEARLLIANSYYLENRLSESVKAHKELLESQPDVPIRARSLFELGICYRDLGDKKNAEKYFLYALKDHPRPDLVQMQLHALRDQIDQESQPAAKASKQRRHDTNKENHAPSATEQSQSLSGTQNQHAVTSNKKPLPRPAKSAQQPQTKTILPTKTKTQSQTPPTKAKTTKPQASQKQDNIVKDSAQNTKVNAAKTKPKKAPAPKQDTKKTPAVRLAPKDVATPDH